MQGTLGIRIHVHTHNREREGREKITRHSHYRLTIGLS